MITPHFFVNVEAFWWYDTFLVLACRRSARSSSDGYRYRTGTLTAAGTLAAADPFHGGLLVGRENLIHDGGAGRLSSRP
jgi:hypothetical protein